MTGRAHMHPFFRSILTARACTVSVPRTVCRTVPGEGSDSPFRLAPLRICLTFPFLSAISPERSTFFLKYAANVAALAVLLSLLAPFAARAEDTSRKAPSFRLNDINGRLVALDDYAGHVILVNFWATWCTSCREELAELDRLYLTYRERGFIVIGISVDASAERVAAFLKKRPVGFPVVTDTQGDVADAYRFSGLPAAFLIGRNGVIERRYRGSGAEVITQYEKGIISLLQGK